MLGKEIMKISKQCFSYKFYQRISPSAKLMMLKHNLSDLPTNIKFITKEVILNFMEKLEKDKLISKDTSILWKDSKQTESNKQVVKEEIKVNSNQKIVEEKKVSDSQSKIKVQGYMSIKLDLENAIIDLKLDFSNPKLRVQSIEKLLNFTKKAAVKCSFKFKELSKIDFEKNSR
jgi:hypothetical protein